MKNNLIKILKIAGCIEILFFIGFGAYCISYTLLSDKNLYDIIANFKNILLVSSTTALIIFICLYCFEVDIEKRDDYREYLVNELEKNESEKDIITLMIKNSDEIADYFKISKRQARSSFAFSIIACIIGIVMIGLSLYAVFSIKDTEFAIIGVIGGSVTEVIAGTVLVIHNKSALQLNYYYDALHQNEKFLSAINLADKLGKDKKEQIYIEIIRTQIKFDEKIKEEKKSKKKEK